MEKHTGHAEPAVHEQDRLQDVADGAWLSGEGLLQTADAAWQSPAGCGKHLLKPELPVGGVAAESVVIRHCWDERGAADAAWHNPAGCGEHLLKAPEAPDGGLTAGEVLSQDC